MAAFSVCAVLLRVSLQGYLLGPAFMHERGTWVSSDMVSEAMHN